MNIDNKLERIVEIVKESADDCTMLQIKMVLNDGHHDEWTSRYLVSGMEPVCYVGMVKKPSSMCEWMDMLGITPKKAYDMVNETYEEARNMASELGITAPKPNANMWDCWWCIAMMLSDYWITVEGDVDKASQMAYEYLSDPDRR